MSPQSTTIKSHGAPALPPVVDAATFKAAMAEMPAAVNVITARAPDGEPVGATLSAVISLSLEPPMMLAAFDRGSATLKALTPGAPFLIHLLAEGQEALGYAMAKKGPEKFDDVALAEDPSGLPHLPGCAAAMLCDVAECHEGGDHVIITARVHRVEHSARTPLVYHRKSLFPMPLKETLA